MRLFIIIFYTLVFGFAIMACNNSKQDLPPLNETGERVLLQVSDGLEVNFNDELKGVVMLPLPIHGRWQVIEYSKRKIDQSKLFAGHTLVFHPAGTIDIMEGNKVISSGTFLLSPINDTHNLSISLPKGSPVPNLNYTWTRVSSEEGMLVFEYLDKSLVLSSENN